MVPTAWDTYARARGHNSGMTDPAPLEQLVEDAQYDDLLAAVSVEEIAAAWLRYHRERQSTLDEAPDWWAVNLWISPDWWEHDEALLREGVRALTTAARTDHELDQIGASILEVLIDEDEDRLRWIEAQAATTRAFRRSLANVLIWGSEPDAVAARVERAAGIPLTKPRAE